MPVTGFFGSQFDALTCTETNLQDSVRWLYFQQVNSPGGFWFMLANHPRTCQPSHQTAGRAVLAIPYAFETLFQVHDCTPLQRF